MKRTEVAQQLGIDPKTLKKTLTLMDWGDVYEFSDELLTELREVRERIDREGYDWMKEVYGGGGGEEGGSSSVPLIDSKALAELVGKKLERELKQELGAGLSQAVDEVTDRFLSSELPAQMLYSSLLNKPEKMRTGFEKFRKKLSFSHDPYTVEVFAEEQEPLGLGPGVIDDDSDEPEAPEPFHG